MTAKPRGFINENQFLFAARIGNGALRSKGSGKLGDEGEWAKAAPKCMAEHYAEQHSRQADIPEDVVREAVAADLEVAADVRASHGSRGHHHHHKQNQPSPKQKPTQNVDPLFALSFRVHRLSHASRHN